MVSWKETIFVAMCCLAIGVGFFIASRQTREATSAPIGVLCYSGGNIIYQGIASNGVVQGDGFIRFHDTKTGTKMTIRNADCMIAEY